MTPVDPQMVLLQVVMAFQVPLVGTKHRIANITSQMNIGRRDQYGITFFLDRHNALERMRFQLARLFMTNQTHDFAAMRFEKTAGQTDKSGGLFVINAMAGRTKLVNCLLGRAAPAPAPLMIDSPALGASH